MWTKVKNYFLAPFRDRSNTELKKAFYLLLSSITVLVFFVFLLGSHTFFFSGGVYQLSDILGIAGTLLAIYQFRRGNIETAGKVLIAVIIIMFSVQTVLTDYWRTDPAIRYRLYVTLVCILGTYFLFISFFRSVRLLIYFGVVFMAILTLHFLIILRQIGDDPTYAMYSFEHYIISCAALVFATIVSGILVTLIEKLYTQAIRQGETIKRQNEELHHTVEEQTKFLVSSNESLKEFAYLTSHDLREPLRNISGFISLIKKHSDNKSIEANKAEIDEYFNYVQKGVAQMEDLISDIKVYSGINVLEKNFSPVSMGDLVYQVRDSLEAEIIQANATLRIRQGMPVVNGDKTLLFAMMQNLVSNAIKYRKQGVAPIVEIGYTESNGPHTFSVEDNGIGIDKNYYDRIFYAFKRLHSKDGEYEGTGLGLAICKKIVEIHGGRIWVESTEGTGSTFYFTLK